MQTEIHDPLRCARDAACNADSSFLSYIIEQTESGLTSDILAEAICSGLFFKQIAFAEQTYKTYRSRTSFSDEVCARIIELATKLERDYLVTRMLEDHINAIASNQDKARYILSLTMHKDQTEQYNTPYLVSLILPHTQNVTPNIWRVMRTRVKDPLSQLACLDENATEALLTVLTHTAAARPDTSVTALLSDAPDWLKPYYLKVMAWT